MTARLVGARRRAEQRDRLAGRDAVDQRAEIEPARVGRQLREQAPPVLGEVDRRLALAVDGGVKRRAWAELLAPLVPGLVLLSQAARPVAADEDPGPVAFIRRVVPAPRPDFASPAPGSSCRAVLGYLSFSGDAGAALRRLRGWRSWSSACKLWTVMRATQPSLVLLFALIACGGDDDTSGTQADASTNDAAAGGDAALQDGGDRGDAAASVQLIVPFCAPNDAPSLRIALGEPAGGDDCALDDFAPSVTVEIWTQIISAPIIVSFSPTEGFGSGTICPGGDPPCRTYDTGDITFEKYEEGKSASGSWRLFAGSEVLSGTFDSTWCEPDPPDVCG